MAAIVVTVLIGVLGGLAVGVQGPLANAISVRLGGAASSLVVHVSGAVLSALVLILRGGEQIGNWRELPWYMWGAGAFGVILYLTISYTMPRLGATAAIALIIIGQLAAGMVIDQFGLFGTALRPIDPTRVVAALLLLAGGYLAVR
ncbi:MAG: DMT family transporter [Anaerolineae bacterium]